MSETKPDQELGTGIRERILAAAFSAFMQHGYTGASTLEIARRARVSKRDLYAQFGSKQAMLAACISCRAARMQKPMPLPAPQTSAALAATLTAFGARLLREVSRPEVLAVYRLAIMEAERAPEVARTLDELGRVGVKTELAALLQGAQSSGLLGAGDPAAMAEDLVALLWSGGLMQRLLLRVATPPDEDAASERASRAAAQFLQLYGHQMHGHPLPSTGTQAARCQAEKS